MSGCEHPRESEHLGDAFGRYAVPDVALAAWDVSSHHFHTCTTVSFASLTPLSRTSCRATSPTSFNQRIELPS